jgi:hypothetical protein
MLAACTRTHVHTYTGSLFRRHGQLLQDVVLWPAQQTASLLLIFIPTETHISHCNLANSAERTVQLPHMHSSACCQTPCSHVPIRSSWRIRLSAHVKSYVHCFRLVSFHFVSFLFAVLPSSTYLFTAGVEVVYFHLITLRHTPQSAGILWMRDRPVSETSTWQHKQLQETNIHAPGGIRTHDPSKRLAADPRLRPSHVRKDTCFREYHFLFVLLYTSVGYFQTFVLKLINIRALEQHMTVTYTAAPKWYPNVAPFL